MFNEIGAQTYLEQNYPTPEDKVNCQFLNLETKNEKNPNGLEVKLTGPLDLTGFTNLKTLWCDGSGGNKITTLTLQDCLQLADLQCWGNELTELDLSNCSQLEMLICHRNKLTNLDLSNCEKLKCLSCQENQLTRLDLRQNKQLTLLGCDQNQLTQLNLPPKLPDLKILVCSDNFLTDLDWASLNGEKLTALRLGNNNFTSHDLSYLVGFTNLKDLYLQNTKQAKIQQGIYNRWIGSLQPLQNMRQLHTLHIDNTDLDSGIGYLPASVMEIYCSRFLRTDSKIKFIVKELEQNSNFVLVSSVNNLYLKRKLHPEIINQLKNFNHWWLTPEQEKLLAELIPSIQWRKHYKENGLCTNCWQLNGWDSWCYFCNFSHLRANFANWTSGQEEIDKLIQKCQLEAKNRNGMLEWIPYEHFFKIEYLTEGGFSKIYTAIWTEGAIKGWNARDNKLKRLRNEWVILKSFNNSQNMTAEFLQEIINYKLVVREGDSGIVICYGISQEPETGNYLMVMRSMGGGNLRQFLQRNYQQLNFQDRVVQLINITQGLQSIHETNLVHQDFHPGNVLNTINTNTTSGDRAVSLISDLGLSRPANETNKDKIYGVLPYVAPEVLRDKIYTQKSDIFSFGMIAYELFSNQPPLVGYAYDSALALRICEGLRPNLEEVIAPQLLKDLISRCWDAQPEQRPTAGEIRNILSYWLDENLDNKDNSFFAKKRTEFYHQYQELVVSGKLDLLTNKPFLNYSVEKSISRSLDFKNFPEPQNSQELNERFWNSLECIRTVEFGVSGLGVGESNEISPDINRWKNIHPNFTPELVNCWISHGFTTEQCQDWININSPPQQHLAIQEPEYYAWIRDSKQVNSDWVLNQGNSEQLRQEFRQWEQEQLRAEIQIPVKEI